MKSKFILIFILLNIFTFGASPVIGTTSFSNASNGTFYLGTASTSGVASGTWATNILNSGWDATCYITNVGTNDFTLQGKSASPAISTDPYLIFIRASTTTSVNYIRLKANDGSAFKLNSINLNMVSTKQSTMSLKIEGYKSGNLVAGANATQSYSSALAWSTVTVSSNTSFQNIDEIKITALNSDGTALQTGVGVDEINISNAITNSLSTINTNYSYDFKVAQDGNFLNIFSQNSGNVSLYNMNAVRVKEIKISNGENKSDISYLPKGVYLLTGILNEKKLSKKIIIK